MVFCSLENPTKLGIPETFHWKMFYFPGKISDMIVQIRRMYYTNLDENISRGRRNEYIFSWVTSSYGQQL